MSKSFHRKIGKTIMAHDPSMTAWGWVIVTPGGKVIDHGCIRTEPSAAKLNIFKGDDRIRRLNELNLALSIPIKKYNPVLQLCELPHGSQSAVAALMVGAVAGVISTIAFWTETPIEYYSESEGKKGMSGKRILSKTAMVEAVGKKYKVKWLGFKYYDEAVADAIAIFNCAKKRSEILKFLTK